MLKKIVKIIAWFFGIVVALLLIAVVYVRAVGHTEPPAVPEVAGANDAVSEPAPGLYKWKGNWFRQSESGLYELYVEGDPYERGLANGKLTQALVQHQEEVFTEQIHRLVPNNAWLGVLKYFVAWFNRDLADNISEEFKQEIYGVSQVASHEFDDIAPPYHRILNYHAAHDIGHALQNMSLVGCTAFATWADGSDDSTMIVGRNFDFYVGDDFARDKIIAFYNPSQGHKFMMITFGGMTGVLSGMNDQGLTVTINAAKSEIPTASATPVSLVAREILQYASTIAEAQAIAAKRKMFVAESFLIASAKDRKAALIEKSPEGIGFYEAKGHALVSTNHFQGETLGNTELNREHMRTSASPYRYQRVEELMQRNGKNSVTKTAAILRNQLGLKDADIGMGNEKAINQLVAHHGVIFQPEKGLVWISTAPWQLGKFVCYDINKVFATSMDTNHELYDSTRTIQADTFLQTPAYNTYLKFSPYRFPFNPRADIQPDSVVKWNPESYHAYMLAGDYCYDHEEWQRAIDFYTAGLTKEVATVQEREHMQRNLEHSKQALQ